MAPSRVSMDFRDHDIRKALDDSVGPYRPEKTRRSRVLRIAAVAALAITASIAFITVVNRSTPRHAPAVERKPITVELLPTPVKP